MKPAEKLDKALEYIADARNEVQQGKIVTLEGFQNEVRKICADIAALPHAEMRIFQPKLNELSATLDILEKELREQQTKIQQEIFALNRKHKALKTYETVSHSHKVEKITDKKDGNK